MRARDERDLRTLVAARLGELDPAAREELEQRCLLDAGLRERRHGLERLWSELAPPEPEPLPLGGARALARRVLARSNDDSLAWRAAPLWVRAGGAAALAAGLLAGVLATRALPRASLDGWSEPSTLAESYAEALLASPGGEQP